MFVSEWNLVLKNPMEATGADVSRTGSIKRLAREAKQAGHDALIVRDYLDGAAVSDIYAVFDESCIRPASESQGPKKKTRKHAARWGMAGAGILYVCPGDQTCMLMLRSNEVQDPGVWGIPGGAVKGTEGFHEQVSDEGISEGDFWVVRQILNHSQGFVSRMHQRHRIAQGVQSDKIHPLSAVLFHGRL